MENREKTGFPHIDKPWMKYYESSDYFDTPPIKNILEYVKYKNLGRDSYIDETFYTRDITFGETYQRINDASRVLTNIGVRKGDRILYLVPTMPTATQLFFASAQIGANADYIDPRPDSMDLFSSAKKVLDLVKREQPKYIFAIDRCYIAMLSIIENELKDSGVEKIVVIPNTIDFSLLGRLDYINDIRNYNKIKNFRLQEENVKKISNTRAVLQSFKSMLECNYVLKEKIKNRSMEVLMYDDLLHECKNSLYYIDSDPETIVYTGHTSGTSGSLPKPIQLSNANLISSVEQLFQAGINFKPGDKIIQELPYFAPFGLCNNMLLNKASGAHSYPVIEFEINEFSYLLKKYKPECILTPPAWEAAIPDAHYLTSADLKNLKRIVYGGDSMTESDEKKILHFLSELGNNNCVIEKGHGMSEYGGCGSFSQRDWNEPDSMGIPLPNTIYAVVDPNIEDKLVPIKFEDGEDFITGELVVSTPALTNGMLHDEVIVPRYELDGKEYIRTRDLVKMRRDGSLFFESRTDRTFARFDGYKYKPREVEKIIENSKYVDHCVISSYHDVGKNGIMPIAHVVLKEEYRDSELTYEEIVKAIINSLISHNTTSSRQIPTKFRFHEELPLTRNGKIDFKNINEAEYISDEINIKIDETNLSVGNVLVYTNNSNTKRLTR